MNTAFSRALDLLFEGTEKAIFEAAELTREHESWLMIDNMGCFMKFMSDMGKTDTLNGIAFAKWLRKKKISFKQGNAKEGKGWQRYFIFTPNNFLKLLRTLEDS